MHSGLDARLGSQPSLPPAGVGAFNIDRKGFGSTLGVALSRDWEGVSPAPLMSWSFVKMWFSFLR